MIMKTSHLLLPLLLISVELSVPASAQAAPPPVFVVSDKTASDRADELVKRALVFGDKDRYTEAAPLVREAWSLKRSYDIAANLGIVEAALNEWRNAAEHITYALKTFPANGKPEHRKLLEETLARTLPRIAALTIKVNVDRAEVFVDDKSVGLAPLVDVVFVEPGMRTIKARLSGYDTATLKVEAAKGGSSESELTLRQSAPPSVQIGAVVPPLTTEHPPPDQPRRVVVGVGVGAATVALGLGVAFTIIANGRGDDAATMRGNLAKGQPNACGSTPAARDCQALHELWSERAKFSNAAAWSFIGAGVLGAATVGFALLGPKRSSRTEIHAIPAVGPGTAGLVVHGIW